MRHRSDGRSRLACEADDQATAQPERAFQDGEPVAPELVLHEGQVLPHQTLTDRVWGYEGVDDASLLKGHIRNMRRKLEDDSSTPHYIHTVAGVGYTFRRGSA